MHMKVLKLGKKDTNKHGSEERNVFFPLKKKHWKPIWKDVNCCEFWMITCYSVDFSVSLKLSK